MDNNKEILTENKVQQLMNLKKFAQAQTFKKVLSNIFNVSLDNGDIHYIFERLNTPFSMMNVRGMSVKYYNRDAIIDTFYKGLLSREIESLTRNRKGANTQPKPQIPGYGKSVVVNTTNRHIPNDNNSMEDEFEYPNGENDMEKYSEYLINNVYEEKKNMNKITINENDIKQMVNESVRKILKEEYWNYDLKNELRNCNTLYRKLYDFLEYMQFAHVDDMDNSGDNDIPLYKVMCSGYHLLEDLADFRQDRERKRMKK